MTVATLFGLLAAISFALAAIAAFAWSPAPWYNRLHFIGLGLFFLTLYFLFGGGTLEIK